MFNKDDSNYVDQIRIDFNSFLDTINKVPQQIIDRHCIKL